MSSAGKAAAALLACVLLLAALASAAVGSLLSPFGGNRPTESALSDIPANYLGLYADAAASCPGLNWSVLAAVGKVESDHGRSTLPGVHSGANYAGARGPMQFLPSTFTAVLARHPSLRSGTRAPSPYDPRDAIQAAAAYLCDSGARHGENIPGAIRTYNHDDAYVTQVLSRAQTYGSRSEAMLSDRPSSAARDAIAYAKGQLGLPYEWGGNGPGKGDAGFDCSGLTQAAYASAGIRLPRIAQQQFTSGPRVPADEQPRPGDLIFYGQDAASIHHVGLYIGSGQMIHAPGRHRLIRIAPYRYRGDDFVGTVRPVA
ncbi:NlpC/P60 family protein [Streptomyces sp. NPDC102360]|uniref:C40 family peptidase n=1 Tax=Streptomyces sp. NPDC102360 TaxID=3366160 RepID=UPI003819BC75